MIILDPTAISDVTHSRASPGTYIDADGVLQTAAANALRFSYSLSDLTAGARALVERESTNLLNYSQGSGGISSVGSPLTFNYASALDGTPTAGRFLALAGSTAYFYDQAVTVPGLEYSGSIYVKANAGHAAPLYVKLSGQAGANITGGSIALEGPGTATDYSGVGADWEITGLSTTQWTRIMITNTSQSEVYRYLLLDNTSATLDVDILFSHRQVEQGEPTSVIVTAGSPVTRAADVVGVAGTVLGSNVPETDAPAYSAGTLYALGDQVVADHCVYQSAQGLRAAVTASIASPASIGWAAHGLLANTPVSFSTTGALPTGLVPGTVYYVLSPTPNAFNLSATPGGAAINTSGSQSGVHTLTAGQNVNRAVSDVAYWALIGATNQRKMVDQYNNTQTTAADVIIMTFNPRQIAQGLYLGGLDADSISIVVEDPNEGIVYSSTDSLVISSSASSFFNWLFKRIRRKTYFFTGLLPVYYNARVTITIRRVGGNAKCGMCVIGPLIDIGLSQYGLGTEIKDYSSSTFDFDGTSNTVVRGYAKLMSVDISIANDQVDFAQEQLGDFRQKPVVYVGTALYGSAIVYGKFSSFKNVISYPSHSVMALNIQGTV